jgi:hypothetical protein
MTDKPAISKGLWAPIHTPQRGQPWVNWRCVRTTRKAAKEALLENIDACHHKRHLQGVRFARVTITEATP